MLSPHGKNGIYFLNNDCSQVVGLENLQDEAEALRVEGSVLFLSKNDNNFHKVGQKGVTKGEGNAIDFSKGLKDRLLIYKFDYGVNSGVGPGSEYSASEKNKYKADQERYEKEMCKK